MSYLFLIKEFSSAEINLVIPTAEVLGFLMWKKIILRNKFNAVAGKKATDNRTASSLPLLNSTYC